MSKATQLLERLTAASFRNIEVDWEQLLRLNYSVLLEANRSFLDVGGNLGAHAICFLDDMQATNLAIFEPIPDLLQHLRQRFANRNNVTVYPYALSNRTGQASFYVKANALAESGLAQKGAYADGKNDNLMIISVSVLKLDDIKLGFLPDFIKIDIEGAEIDMLHGGIATIAKARPIISVEYGNTGYEAFGHAVEALPNWAHNNGYEIFDLFGNRLGLHDFLACVNRFYWDYLLVPIDRMDALAERFDILRRVTLQVPLSKWRQTNLDVINRI